MKRLEGYDLVILLMAVALTCFGVVMVYSASSVMAAKKFHDGFYFLKRQGIYACLGFGTMILAMRIDYQTWKRMAVPLLFAEDSGDMGSRPAKPKAFTVTELPGAMFRISPATPSASAARRFAATTLSTNVKSRDCSPSP